MDVAVAAAAGSPHRDAAVAPARMGSLVDGPLAAATDEATTTNEAVATHGTMAAAGTAFVAACALHVYVVRATLPGDGRC